MPSFTIATWNINSVRIRLDLISRFIDEARPDVLCLQEIKCRDGEFPSNAFARMGLPHLQVVGQKGWHGVAIASRWPLEPAAAPSFCPRDEARVAAARVAGVIVHNVYVPAGGDLPDPQLNPKFAHKLSVLQRMRAHYAKADRRTPLVLVGDLNVAPGENDVWSHKQLLNVVSHTPVETAHLDSLRHDGGFVDLARRCWPEPAKLYTWWSYRNQDWKKSNRGRRLDHIWASEGIASSSGDLRIHIHARDWGRPSDHVPVTARICV